MPDIFEEIARIRRERSNASLATVVGGERGVPGKIGFRMLVYPDGTILGTVGGGLLEAKIREEALRCLHDKKSRLLEFTLNDQSADGIGVLCGGKVKVFVEPILGTSTLYVFGGGHIAVPLVEFAKALEFAVVVVDDREEFANRKRFPIADEVKLGDFGEVTKSTDFHVDDCVVIITRGHQHDEVVLKECLSKKRLPGYIGMIGSKEKVTATFSHLKEEGVSSQLLEKVRAPIGLDIGARTPAEIALSIMAEIVAYRYGKISEQGKQIRGHRNMKTATRDMRILFVCVENAGRSQMAEAFAKRLGVDAGSAGTLPSKTVNPIVVSAMREKGIDLSAAKPKMLTTQMIEDSDIVVTMGCSVEQLCPAPLLARMQKKLLDWDLDDPRDQPIEKVREIRDEIERKVEYLLSKPNLG